MTLRGLWRTAHLRISAHFLKGGPRRVLGVLVGRSFSARAASSPGSLCDLDVARRLKSSLSEVPAPPVWQLVSQLQNVASLSAKHAQVLLPPTPVSAGKASSAPSLQRRESASQFDESFFSRAPGIEGRDALWETLQAAAEEHAEVLSLKAGELQKAQLQSVLESAALILALRARRGCCLPFQQQAKSLGFSQRQEGSCLFSLIAIALPRFEHALHTVPLAEVGGLGVSPPSSLCACCVCL